LAGGECGGRERAPGGIAPGGIVPGIAAPIVGAPAGSLLPDNLKYLRETVYAGAGIVLDDSKRYLLEARLTPIARERGVTSVNDLCALLRATREDGLRRRVVEAMTTNETYFFRDPGHFEALKKKILPEWRLQKAGRKFAAWSAAASTGQEAYSLALLLSEEGFTEATAQITGTDINTQVLDRARAGKFQQVEVNRGLPTPMLLKYFTHQGLEFTLKEPVRRMARFEPMDLRKVSRQLGPFDFVFCRNVLIYFDVPTRKEILKGIHSRMFKGGCLLLGTAEMHPGMDELFQRRDLGGAAGYVAI
jgi:chemotaxis protein methyltransferase CheR